MGGMPFVNVLWCCCLVSMLPSIRAWSASDEQPSGEIASAFLEQLQQFESLASSHTASARSLQAYGAPPGQQSRQVMCASQIGSGVGSLMSAGMAIWGSITRCEAMAKQPGRHNTVACMARIGGVLAALAHVSQYIVDIFSYCFKMSTQRPNCVHHALGLAGSISALASSAGNVDLGCVHRVTFLTNPKVNGAACAIDIRSVMTSMLQILTSAVNIKSLCAVSPESCVSAVTGTISILASISEFVLAAIRDCGSKFPIDSACGSSVSALVGSTAQIVSVATGVEKACKPHPPTQAPPIGAYGNYTTVPPAVAGYVQWVRTQLASGRTQADIQAQTIGAMKSNLTYIQRKFDPRPLKASALQLQGSSAMMPANTLLLGLVPLGFIASFMAGRRMGRGSHRLSHRLEPVNENTAARSLSFDEADAEYLMPGSMTQ